MKWTHFVALRLVHDSKLLHLARFTQKSLLDTIESVNAGFTSVEKLHITLGVFAAEENIIIEAFDRLTFQDFEKLDIRVSEIGHFRHDVLFLKPDSNPDLEKLFSSVAQQLNSHGIQSNATPFNPHITLFKSSMIRKKDLKKSILENIKAHYDQVIAKIGPIDVSLTIDTIELCVMGTTDKETRYYEVLRSRNMSDIAPDLCVVGSELSP